MIFGIFSFLNKEVRFAKRSSRWPKVREQYLQKCPNCAACGRKSKVEVHHKIPVHMAPELELDMDNLITLCDDPCHFVFGHLFNYRSYNKNVEEDCAVYLNKVKTRP